MESGKIEGTKIEKLVMDLVNSAVEISGKNPAKIMREWGDSIDIIVNDLIEKRDAIIEIDKKENQSKLDVMTKYTFMLDILLHADGLREQTIKEISGELKEAYKELEETYRSEYMDKFKVGV